MGFKKMKLHYRIMTGLIFWYLLTVIISYVDMLRFGLVNYKEFLKPSLYHFYGWWLLEPNVLRYNASLEAVRKDVWRVNLNWQVVTISSVIVVICLLLLYKKPIFAFIKTKYRRTKSNSKKARIEKLEKQIKELKEKSE